MARALEKKTVPRNRAASADIQEAEQRQPLAEYFVKAFWLESVFPDQPRRTIACGEQQEAEEESILIHLNVTVVRRDGSSWMTLSQFSGTQICGWKKEMLQQNLQYVKIAVFYDDFWGPNTLS